MKRKQIIQPNININVDKETPAETIENLMQIFNPQKQKEKTPAKQKRIELYLLDTDIETIHARYDELFKQVRSSQYLSEKQIEKECNTLSEKYDFIIEEYSRLREVEYKKRQAQIEAKNKEQTPWRRSWLWRLIFKPTTNRAQDIIDNEAELEADALFTALEKELETRAKALYKSADTADNVQESAEPEPPPPPARKPRKKTTSTEAPAPLTTPPADVESDSAITSESCTAQETPATIQLN